MTRRRPVLAFLLASLLAGVGGPATAAEPLNPCELLTAKDAAVFFQATVADGALRSSVMDGGQSCRYRSQDSRELRALSLKVATTESIREAGLFDSAEDVMMRQQRARKASDDASKMYVALSGLGDEAFWQGDSLYVRKGDVLLVIEAEPALSGQFDSPEAMQAAKAERSLSLSREVAKAVLLRLP